MKSGTATAPLVDRKITQSDSADRILKSVQLAQEKAIQEAQELTRREVRNSLLSRFNLEITELQLRFDRRLAAATEVLLQQMKDEATVAQLRITRLEQALRAASAGAQQESDHAGRREVGIVESEIVRVRLRLEELEKAIADPAADLGFEIRLNRERSELAAYLKGLRYPLGDGSLDCLAVENSSKA